MFNPYARVLEHVPRWTILNVIRRQHVASHSFYVGLYVAELIDGYCTSWPESKKYRVLKAALVHDMAEARMGDVPGPVKRSVIDRPKWGDYENRMAEAMGYGWANDEAMPLIKVADLIDECLYLSSEQLLGNSTLAHVLMHAKDRLRMAVKKAGLPDDVISAVESQVWVMQNFEGPVANGDVQP